MNESTGASDYPPRNWLQSKMTDKEIAREMARYRGKNAFARSGQRWQPGDEVWWFSSPAELWEILEGRGGIALVRRGRPIAYVITHMS